MRKYTNGNARQPEAETELNELLAPARMQRNFDRLWASIEAQSDPMPQRTAYPPRTHWAWPAALLASLAVSMVSLYFALTPHPAAGQGPYQTLADASTQPMRCGQLRVRFQENLALADLRSLLLAAHSSIIDGPSQLGTFTLKTDAPDIALQTLRQHPLVLLAEPVSC